MVDLDVAVIGAEQGLQAHAQQRVIVGDEHAPADHGVRPLCGGRLHAMAPGHQARLRHRARDEGLRESAGCVLKHVVSLVALRGRE